MAQSKRSGAGNVQTRRGNERPATEADYAGLSDEDAEAIGNLVGSDVVMVTCNVGAFQIAPPRWLNLPSGDREFVEGITLDFPHGIPIAVDEDTAEAIQQVLAGTYEGNGNKAGAKKLQAAAIADGLALLRPGLLAPLLPSWDVLGDDKVVEIAAAGGFLESAERVRYAIALEKQRDRRTADHEVPLQPRELVVHDLEALLLTKERPGGQAGTLHSQQVDIDTSPVSL